MDRDKLDKILKNHMLWLNDKKNGVRADLSDANLNGAYLNGAYLSRANLRGADLRCADLRGAYLDFSVFPLWCGSFKIKDDGRLTKQLLGHIARLNITDKKLKAWVNKIPKKYKNDICKRHDVKEV